MLRHRSGTQQQQQPGHARSLSFSEGVAAGDNTQQQQQQQQQQRRPLGSRPASDNNSSHAFNGSSNNSSSNGLSFKPLVQLSGYFDIAALSSKLQSARSFGRRPGTPTFAGVTSE
jgi:hypothetical protein